MELNTTHGESLSNCLREAAAFLTFLTNSLTAFTLSVSKPILAMEPPSKESMDAFQKDLKFQPELAFENAVDAMLAAPTEFQAHIYRSAFSRALFSAACAALAPAAVSAEPPPQARLLCPRASSWFRHRPMRQCAGSLGPNP